MDRLLLMVYQSLLVLFGIGYLTLRLLRGRGIPGWRQRLGWYPPDLRDRLRRLRRPIWVHCVSLGEVLAAEPLLNQLRSRWPERDWLISTVTPTGQEVARRLLQGPRDLLLYLPWDLGPIVRRAIRQIRPELLLCLETELWPVLFHHLGREGVPILVANGRISPKAFGRYLWIRPFMQRLLSQVSWILAQSPQDARRFAAIGAPKDRILVTGNVKWERTLGSSPSDGEALRSLLGIPIDALLWTAGSTHSGEEMILLEVYRRLKLQHPGLRLLIAPRHPERVCEVEQEVRRAGFSTVRRTQLGERMGVQPVRAEPVQARTRGETSFTLRQAQGERNPIPPGDPIILLDTVGELAQVYSVSDVVFVGGSLVPHGGHNLVEPAAYAKPILTGPHLENFQAIAESLTQAGGAAVVRSAVELEKGIERLLSDPAIRRQMGMRASRVLREHQGATARTVELIAKIEDRPRVLPRVAPLWAAAPGLDPPTRGIPASPVALSTNFFLDRLLAVAEALYWLGLKVVKLLYQKGILKIHPLPAPVVSVGNLTWGGTGKTPLVIHLALALRDRGFHPAVLTRGYGQDEVDLMSRRLDPIPVLAGADRFASGRRAVEEHKADLLLLDDGYQQWRVKKDLEILAVDAAVPFGNGHLIPRGNLREPKAEAARADWIVVRGPQPEGGQEWEQELKRLNPVAPVLKAHYRPVGLWRWPSEESVLLKELEGERVCTLAGIARPDSFESTVESLEAQVALKFRVRDHHPYTLGELLRIFSRCRRHGICRIVTTAKDAVRIPPLLADLLGPGLKGVELLVLEVALEFESDESELLDRIDSLRTG